jgi:glycerol-3-phosphate acyltransferase PlsY
VLAILFSILAGYLIGSIPFGLLLARLKGIDIREHGSKNIGATNVWRVCGPKFGLPVFLLDAVKGAGSVFLGRWLAVHFAGGAEWAPIAAALACLVGHSFPVWLKFKGGKGVASSLGVLLALLPLEGLGALLVWIIVFYSSRYVSLASLASAVVLPIFAVAAQLLQWGHGWPSVGFAVLVSLLVIIRHKANIQRLLAGTENRFGRKAKPADQPNPEGQP